MRTITIQITKCSDCKYLNCEKRQQCGGIPDDCPIWTEAQDAKKIYAEKISEKVYICLECGFHGSDDEFERHTISEGYNYGHNNAEPDEVELQCPDCGTTEDNGITEAKHCDYCDKWVPIDSITHDSITHIDNGY